MQEDTPQMEDSPPDAPQELSPPENASELPQSCRQSQKLKNHRFYVIVIVIMALSFAMILVALILVIGATRPSNPNNLTVNDPTTLPKSVVSGFLAAPVVLYPGGVLFSPSYQAAMLLSDDLYVNLVGTFTGKNVWTPSASAGGVVASLLLETNGLLSILNAQGSVIWTSGILGDVDSSDPYGLFVMDDGNLIVARQSEAATPSNLPTVGLWTSAGSGNNNGRVEVLNGPFSFAPNMFVLLSSTQRYQATFTDAGVLQVVDVTLDNALIWQAPPQATLTTCKPTKMNLTLSGLLVLTDSAGTSSCWDSGSANLNVLNQSLSESFSMVLTNTGVLQLIMTSVQTGTPVQTLIWSSDPTGSGQVNPSWSVCSPWSGTRLLLNSPLGEAKLQFGSNPSDTTTYTQGVLMFYSTQENSQGVALSPSGGDGSVLRLDGATGNLQIAASATGATLWTLPSGVASGGSTFPVTLGCVDSYVSQKPFSAIFPMNAAKGSSGLWTLPSALASPSAVAVSTLAATSLGYVTSSQVVTGKGASLSQISVYLIETAPSPYALIINTQTGTFGVLNYRALTAAVISSLSSSSSLWIQKQVFPWSASTPPTPRLSWLKCGLLSLVTASDPAQALWTSGTAEMSQASTSCILALASGVLKAFWGASATGTPFWQATAPLSNSKMWSHSSSLTATLPSTLAFNSVNGAYLAAFQGDGNLVLYKTQGSVVMWASNTAGTAKSLVLTAQGELSLQSATGSVLWEATSLPQAPLQNSDFPVILNVSNDGFFQLSSGDMSKAATPIWKINGQIQLQGSSTLSSTAGKTFAGADYPLVLLSSGKKTALFYLPDGSLETYPVMGASGMLGTRIWTSTQQTGQGQLAQISGTPGFNLQLTQGGLLWSASPGGQVAWTSQSANNFDPGSPFTLELCDNGFLRITSSNTTTNPDSSVWFSTASIFQVGSPRTLSQSGVLTQDPTSWLLVSPNGMYKVTLDTTKMAFVLTTTDPSPNAYSCSNSSKSLEEEAQLLWRQLEDKEETSQSWGRQVEDWSYAWRYRYKKATKPRWKVHQRLVVETQSCGKPRMASSAKATPLFHFGPTTSSDGKSLLVAYLTDSSGTIHPLIQTLASTTYTAPLTLALSNSSQLESPNPLLYVMDAKSKLIATYPQDVTMPTQVVANSTTPVVTLTPGFSMVSVGTGATSYVLTFQSTGILELFSNGSASKVIWSSTLPSSVSTKSPELLLLRTGALMVIDSVSRQNLWNTGSANFNSASSHTATFKFDSSSAAVQVVLDSATSPIWASSQSTSNVVPNFVVGSSWQKWALPTDDTKVINILKSQDQSLWLLGGYDATRELPFLALSATQNNVSGSYLWSSFEEIPAVTGAPSFPVSSYTHSFVFNEVGQAQLWATAKSGSSDPVLIWQSSMAASAGASGGPYLLYVLNTTGGAVSQKLVCSSTALTPTLWTKTQPATQVSTGFVGPSSSTSSSFVSSYLAPTYISSSSSSNPRSLLTVSDGATLPLTLSTLTAPLLELVKSFNWWNTLSATTATDTKAVGSFPMPPYFFRLDKRGNCWLSDSDGRTLWSTNTGQPTSALTLPVTLKVSLDSAGTTCTLGLYDAGTFATNPYWSLQSTESKALALVPSSFGGSFSSPCTVQVLPASLGPSESFEPFVDTLDFKDPQTVWTTLVASNVNYLQNPRFCLPSLGYLAPYIDLELTVTTTLLDHDSPDPLLISHVVVWSASADGVAGSTSDILASVTTNTNLDPALQLDVNQNLTWGYTDKSTSTWNTLWSLSIGDGTQKGLTSSVCTPSLMNVASKLDAPGTGMAMLNFCDTLSGAAILNIPPIQLSSGQSVTNFPGSPYSASVAPGKATFASMNARLGYNDVTKPILHNSKWMICVSSSQLFCWKGTSPPTSESDFTNRTWYINFTQLGVSSAVVYANWRGNLYVVNQSIGGSDAPPASQKPSVLWSSQTSQLDINSKGDPDPRLPFALVLTDSGRLKIRDAQQRVYWSSPAGSQAGIFPRAEVCYNAPLLPTALSWPATSFLMPFPAPPTNVVITYPSVLTGLILPSAPTTCPSAVVWSANGRYLFWNRTDNKLCIYDTQERTEVWISDVLPGAASCPSAAQSGGSARFNLFSNGQLTLQCALAPGNTAWNAGNPASPTNYRAPGSYYPLIFGISNSGNLLLYDSLETPVPITPAVAQVSTVCKTYDPWPNGWPLAAGGTFSCQS